MWRTKKKKIREQMFFFLSRLQICWLFDEKTKITCLVVLPPGSVIGASVIIAWFDFVPTLKLLLPGNAVWMVMPLLPPLPLLLLVVGVWGCWLFMPFPLAVLLLFNDPDDCTNGKLIVTERSSLILCVCCCVLCAGRYVRQKYYVIQSASILKGPVVIFSTFLSLFERGHFGIFFFFFFNLFDLIVIKNEANKFSVS